MIVVIINNKYVKQIRFSLAFFDFVTKEVFELEIFAEIYFEGHADSGGV